MKSTKPKKTKTPEQKHRAKFQRIFKTYGITEEQYKELDNGSCFICERVWSDTVNPCVDHDHVSGKVRGLLCRYCNRYRVGRFRDPDIVQRIVDYLRRGLQSTWIVPPRPKRKRRKRKKAI